MIQKHEKQIYAPLKYIFYIKFTAKLNKIQLSCKFYISEYGFQDENYGMQKNIILEVKYLKKVLHLKGVDIKYLLLKIIYPANVISSL